MYKEKQTFTNGKSKKMLSTNLKSANFVVELCCRPMVYKRCCRPLYAIVEICNGYKLWALFYPLVPKKQQLGFFTNLCVTINLYQK